jgi:hypothetical protein
LPNGVIIPSQDINDLKFGDVQNQPKPGDIVFSNDVTCIAMRADRGMVGLVDISSGEIISRQVRGTAYVGKWSIYGRDPISIDEPPLCTFPPEQVLLKGRSG